MKKQDIALFLETGANIYANIQTCHDNYVMDRENKMQKVEKENTNTVGQERSQ